MYLTSASNDIKLLKLPELEIVRSFAPHNLFTTSLSWNCDNTLLASCGASNDIKIHSDVANDGSTTTFGEDAKHTLLRFSNKSPHLLSSSGDNGLSMLWDTRNLVPVQAFKDLPSKPLSLAFSSDDTVLSVGCDSGHLGKAICMYDLTKVANIHAMTPIEFGNIEGASKIEYSCYERDIMACGSTLGRVHIIDTNMAKIINTFESPDEISCVDISFSTINELLLVSLNKNGRLSFYDISTKKVIKTVETGFKTSCMKMLEDGTTLVTGTNNGRLEVFDLRGKPGSINSIKVHTVAIRSLSLQKKMPESRGRQAEASRSSKVAAPTRADTTEGQSNLEKGSSQEDVSKTKTKTNGRTRKLSSETEKEAVTDVKEKDKNKKKPLDKQKSLKSSTVDVELLTGLTHNFDSSVSNMINEFREDMHADLKHIYTSLVTQIVDLREYVTSNKVLTQRVENLEKENQTLKADIQKLKNQR